MPSAGTIWRTVRHLRVEQSVGRLAYEARRRVLARFPSFVRAVVDGGTGTAFVATPVDWRVDEPEARTISSRALETRKISLAGHEVAVDAWDDGQLPKLVRYHVHYLDVVRRWVEGGGEQAIAAALALTRDWARAHPPAMTESWEPYVVASRLQNLCVLATAVASDERWMVKLVSQHARYLSRWPEIHLQGNHLLKDWCSLALAGLALSGGDPEAWRERALLKLEGEVSHQLLADGGHYERSPMYHCAVLGDLLDVQRLANARAIPIPWLDAAIDRMLHFLEGILHADGDIPLLNDSVLGQAVPPARLFRLAGRPPRPIGLFDAPASGVTAVRRAGGESFFFDSGPIGPDEQPGHAHSDTLSFELSLGGERRIVDGGMDGYQSSRRAWLRSGSAHNSVIVNGHGPDELWASFRVGGRSRVYGRSLKARDDHVECHGALRAFQGWRHARRVAYFPSRFLVVADRVIAPKGAKVESLLQVRQGRMPLTVSAIVGSSAEPVTAIYSPRFGEVEQISQYRFNPPEGRDTLAYVVVWGDMPRIAADESGLSVELGADRVRIDWPSAAEGAQEPK